MIAIDHAPLLAHEDAAISIPVVRNAEVRLVLHDGFLERSWIDGSALMIDVRSIRLVAEHPYRCTQFAEDLRSDLIGRAVGAVHDDPEALKIEIAGQRALDELDVAA